MEGQFPEDLLYTSDHVWCRVDGDVATLGISWHAQEQLGEIVMVELPGVGDSITEGTAFGMIESAKAMSDVLAPLNGEVTEANDGIVDAPERINEDPYDGGWLVRVKMANKADAEKLLKHAAYLKVVESESE